MEFCFQERLFAMRQDSPCLRCLIPVFAAMIAVGCGSPGDQPELGYVSGTVTLDGKPLPGVNIIFRPETGRPAADQTDEEGNYELEYLAGVSGCKLGPNSIAFEWPPEAANVPSIPAKYNSTEMFKVDVKPGNNELNFEMKSK